MQGYIPILLLMYAILQEGRMTEMEEVEHLLNMESTIDLKNIDKLILLIGSIGTGKSTLAKFLINDPSLQRVNVGITNFIYKDNGTISNNTRKWMTILPNVYRDPETKEIIVDCPGFSDTREPKYEIANAFFIKKVMEHPKKLKIVVTENHFSLVEGSDRFGLNRLLIALAELIPNIERFHGSIALVSTKAIPRGNPEYVKSNLLRFLANYKNYLAEDLNSNANMTIQSMMKVLDVLTGNPPGKNIGFFWKPTIMNNQSVDELMDSCKNSIRSLIFNQLTWADNTNAVYHYSVSKESRLFITNTLAPSNLASTVEELKSFLATVKSGAQSTLISTQKAREGIDYLKSLHKELSLFSNQPQKSIHDISNVTQRLAAFTHVKEFNSDVFKDLATKVAFFKSFGVDVVEQLNKVMHTELGSICRWMIENLRNLVSLEVLEEKMKLQSEEANKARKNAEKAAEVAKLLNEKFIIEIKRAQGRTDQESAARVAAAKRESKAADEKASRATEEASRAIERLKESEMETNKTYERIAKDNKDAAALATAGAIVTGVFGLVSTIVIASLIG